MSAKEKKFTEAEKTTLINLVNQYKSVLETKKTDAASNQKKQKFGLSWRASLTQSAEDLLEILQVYGQNSMI